jgi:hypothetical protein
VLPSLNEILTYRHPGVLKNFSLGLPELADRAEELFDDMLRFLWLTKQHEIDLLARPDDEALQFLFVMHEEMRDIDSMWHVFILHTHDYMAFCDRFFGSYMHHEPGIADSHPQSPADFETDLGKLLSYVYDTLGEATVRRWFAMPAPVVDGDPAGDRREAVLA